MKKKKNHRWYRRPKTRAEARANQDCEYARARRRPCNLVDAYDDIQCCHQKTWKVKRLKQYRPGGRGKEHSIIINDNLVAHYYTTRYEFSKYFEKHDIPYRIENITSTKIRKEYYRLVWGLISLIQVPIRTNTFADLVNKQFYYKEVYGYRKIKLDKPIERRYSEHIGLKITWWSDKDIGINYILKDLRIPPHVVMA